MLIGKGINLANLPAAGDYGILKAMYMAVQMIKGLQNWR
jgi:hypothetical protein